MAYENNRNFPLDNYENIRIMKNVRNAKHPKPPIITKIGSRLVSLFFCNLNHIITKTFVLSRGGGENLLEKIKKLCQERGITIAVLEKTLGFGRDTICKWENSIPRADRLKVVADFFEVSMDELLQEEKE